MPRIFQNGSIYPLYANQLRDEQRGTKRFDALLSAFLDGRFDAPHILQPVYLKDAETFFTVGGLEWLQRAWARENGLKQSATLDDILLAQVEHHSAEIFYNTDPTRFGAEFLKRMPSCVKRTVVWWAAPAGTVDVLAHDLIVNNFPGLLRDFATKGAQTRYFFPAHDPVMDEYAGTVSRTVDVLFVGTYSRHHRARAEMLAALADIGGSHTIALRLNVSRATRLAETPLGWVGPLRSLRRPAAVRRHSAGPLFGRKLYAALASAKLVVNGAIDLAGRDRGNMRVWEALGCGACLLTDEGHYPPGMDADRHFATYSSVAHMKQVLPILLRDDDLRERMAASGNQMIRTRFSKEEQWHAFLSLLD